MGYLTGLELFSPLSSPHLNYCPGGGYRSVSGVAGFSAPLTCDITPRLSEDQLVLILWYKIGLPSPVYT